MVLMLFYCLSMQIGLTAWREILSLLTQNLSLKKGYFHPFSVFGALFHTFILIKRLDKYTFSENYTSCSQGSHVGLFSIFWPNILLPKIGSNAYEITVPKSDFLKVSRSAICHFQGTLRAVTMTCEKVDFQGHLYEKPCIPLERSQQVIQKIFNISISGQK